MTRPARTEDAAAIAAIYNPFVRDTTVTFEEEPVTAEEMASRIASISAGHPWLVLEEGGIPVGYAYASAWKPRSAYRRTAECSIYLAPEARGRGRGRELYAALVAELRRRGFHALIGGIALPNGASVALHEGLGFRKVGELAEVGWKLGRSIDVGYWELLLGEGRAH